MNYLPFCLLLFLFPLVGFSQNDCASALLLECGESVVGTTIDMSPSDAPTCVTTLGTGGVQWYHFIGTGEVSTLSLCHPSTTYDSKLFCYSGSCEELECVAGNDDACGTRSELIFLSVLGVEYFVMVGGFQANEGDFELSLSCEEAIVGCMTLGACNYDPDANISGDCDFTCFGCTDPAACDYAPEATIDTGCNYDCYGCTNVDACNFDPEALLDDDSCCLDGCYGLSVGGGDFDDEITWAIRTPDNITVYSGGTGEFDLCLANDCYYFYMFDSFGDGWNSASYTLADGELVLFTGDLESGLETDEEHVGIDVLNFSDACIPGCTDPAACNYDPDATIDFNCDLISCTGCTDPLASNYDSQADIEAGNCVYCSVDEELVTISMCGYENFGWLDMAYRITNSADAVIAENSIATAMLGDGVEFGFDHYCLSPDCYVFETYSTSEQYTYVQYEGFLDDGTVLFDDANTDFSVTSSFDFRIGDPACNVGGCTGPLCTNYNATANFDDGSCECPLPATFACSALEIQCGDSIPVNFADFLENLPGCTNVFSQQAEDVFFKFIADFNGTVQLNTTCFTEEQEGLTLTYTPWITVYETADCEDLTSENQLITDLGNLTTCAEGVNQKTFNVTAGNTYYIDFGFWSDLPTYLSISCNECDTFQEHSICEQAIELAYGETYVGSFCCAGAQNFDPQPWLNYNGGVYDLWFKVATENWDSFCFEGINLTGSDIGLAFHYTASDCSDLEVIALCFDDSECIGSLAQFITFEPEHWVYIRAYTTDIQNCGLFSIKVEGQIIGVVDCEETSCNDPEACNYIEGSLGAEDCEYDLPGISYLGETMICQGESIDLEVLSDGTVFLNSEIQSDTYSFTPESSGSVLVTAVSDELCISEEVIDFTVFPLPEVTIVANGPYLEAQPSGLIYQWYLNGIALEGQASAEILIEQDGIYSVEVTDENGCSAFSEEVFATSVHSSNFSDLLVFPNPATSTITIQTSASLNGNQLTLLDINGRIVSSQVIKGNRATIDVQILPQGLYLLQLQDDDRIIQERIEVAR